MTRLLFSSCQEGPFRDRASHAVWRKVAQALTRDVAQDVQMILLWREVIYRASFITVCEIGSTARNAQELSSLFSAFPVFVDGNDVPEAKTRGLARHKARRATAKPSFCCSLFFVFAVLPNVPSGVVTGGAETCLERPGSSR